MRVFALFTGLAVAAALGMAQKPDDPGSQSGKNATSSSAQSQTKTTKESTSSSSQKSPESASDAKTQTYKGTLVDASCAGGGAVTSSTSSPNQASADRSSSSDKSASKSGQAGANGEASRGGDSASSCTPSAGASDFALRMKDGHTLRFDAVGNERAKLEMTNNKKWKDASAAGKAIQATVSGTESGDTLTVLSLR